MLFSEQILEYAGTNQRYSITGFRISLKRHTSKYLFLYYLPSTLFVITSWISFLIPPEVVPGRMALLVTLLLVLINIFNNVTSITPNTDGMTAIGSWMLGESKFTFFSLCLSNFHFSLHLLHIRSLNVVCLNSVYYT